MNDAWRERQSHRLILLAAVFLLWAIVVGLTGGFAISIGSLRMSSRGMRNVLIGFILLTGIASALAPPSRRKAIFLAAIARLTAPFEKAVAAVGTHVLSRMAGALAVVAAVAVIAIGITRGSFVAGGSDSYGYVSQSRLWVSGTLHVEPPIAVTLPDGLSNNVFVPLGYRLAADGRRSVPTYAPGFPLQMAIAERLWGPDAVYYVMPLLGGGTVVATYLMGLTVAGRMAGLLATLLMALSPTFLFQLTHAPMSDIGAACWWTFALVLLARRTRWAAFLMGVCVALAIVTRPNIVPLAIVPGLWLLTEIIAGKDRALAVTRTMLFGLGPLSASLFIAGLNRSLYGSATESGYGALAGELFRWSYFWPNIVNYSRSLVTTQTFGILLAFAGPVLLWSPIVVAYVGFVVVIYLCYAVYLPMEAWWGLRFFLPIFPILFVFVSAAIVRLPAFLPLGPRVLCSFVVAALMCTGAWDFSRDAAALDSTSERRFADIGRYLADTVPANAVVFAVLHSGSAMHYSGRPTLRFDAVNREQFSAIASDLQRRGHPVFILLDEVEREDFAQRFGPADHYGPRDARAAKLVPTVDLHRMH